MQDLCHIDQFKLDYFTLISQSQQIGSVDQARYLLNAANLISYLLLNAINCSNHSMQMQIKQWLYEYVVNQFLVNDAVVSAVEWEQELINACHLEQYSSSSVDYCLQKMMHCPERIVNESRRVCSILGETKKVVNMEVLDIVTTVVEDLQVSLEGTGDG